MSLIDSLGTNPGDSFPSTEAAAVDAFNYINSLQDCHTHEYAGWIYEEWSLFGPPKYTYDEPTELSPTGGVVPAMGYKMTEPTKSKRAVLVSVERDGQDMRIRLDDAVCKTEKVWSQQEHVTNKLVSAKSFESMEFDEKELADFGHYILARLYAFIKRNEI